MRVSRYIVYALTDPRSGQWRYIGKSGNGLSRPREHVLPGKLNTDGNLHKVRWIKQLQAAGLMYEIEVLEEFESSKGLSEAEMEWIAAARKAWVPLTNLTDGGEGAFGIIRPDAVRLRISAGLIGFKRPPFTVEHRAKISENSKNRPPPFLGRSHSVESREKIAAAKRGGVSPRKGKKFTEEQLLNHSTIRGGRPFVDERGVSYRLQREAAEALGVRREKISDVLRGKRPHTGGHTFKYQDAA